MQGTTKRSKKIHMPDSSGGIKIIPVSSLYESLDDRLNNNTSQATTLFKTQIKQ